MASHVKPGPRDRFLHGSFMQRSSNLFPAKCLSSAQPPSGQTCPLRPARRNRTLHFLRFPPPRFLGFGKGCFLVVRCRFSDIGDFIKSFTVRTITLELSQRYITCEHLIFSRPDRIEGNFVLIVYMHAPAIALDQWRQSKIWLYSLKILFTAHTSTLAIGNIQNIVRCVFIWIINQHFILHLWYRLWLSGWRNFCHKNRAVVGYSNKCIWQVGCRHSLSILKCHI